MGRRLKENLSVTIEGVDYPVTTMTLRGETVYVYWRPQRGRTRKTRIYGRTLDDLRSKIIADAYVYQKELEALMPKGANFYECVEFYLLGCYNQRPTVIKDCSLLVKRCVENSIIDIPIPKITDKLLSGYYKRLSFKYDNESIVTLHDILTETFHFYNSQYPTDFNIGGFEVKSHCVTPFDYILSPEETEFVINYCINEHSSLFGNGCHLIAFSLMSGMRISRAAQLLAKNVDFENKVLRYRKRSDGPERSIALPQDAFNFIEALNKETPFQENQYLFNMDNENAPLSDSSRRVTIRSIMKHCGLPLTVSPYGLFKSGIIRLAEHGTSFSDIKTYFGLRSTNEVKEIQDEFQLQQYAIKPIFKEQN